MTNYGTRREVEHKYTLALLSCLASLVGGFAPSIDMPTTTTEPTTTTPDPATLPFIVDSERKLNVTAMKGTTESLVCQVLRLGDRTVSWMKRVGDRLDLLTFGISTYHSDNRYALIYVFPNNWSLQINSIREGDEGTYECQISTHPPMTKTIHLNVKVPRVEIKEVGGEVIREKFYEKGSIIELQCEAFNVLSDADLTWYKGNVNLSHFNRPPTTSVSSFNETSSSQATPTSSSKSGNPITWLHISSASPNDTGNYSCRSDNISFAEVKLHVLDGEDSVAMQHSTNYATTYYFNNDLMLNINSFCLLIFYTFSLL